MKRLMGSVCFIVTTIIKSTTEVIKFAAAIIDIIRLRIIAIFQG